MVPGAGVYNAASGLATAYARSSPVLLIAGQIPRGQIGKNLGAIHEVFDQAGVMSPVTKWRRQVLMPREVPDAVTEAFRQMRTGRPRPVMIDIPPEVVVEREEVAMRNPAPVSRIVPSPEGCPHHHSSSVAPYFCRMGRGTIRRGAGPRQTGRSDKYTGGHVRRR